MENEGTERGSPAMELTAKYIAETPRMNNSHNRRGMDCQQLRAEDNKDGQQIDTGFHRVYSGECQPDAFQQTGQAFNDVKDIYIEHAFNGETDEDKKGGSSNSANNDFQALKNRNIQPLYNRERAIHDIDKKYQGKLDSIDGKLERNSQKIEALERKKEKARVYKYRLLTYEMDDPWNPNKLLSKESTRTFKTKKSGQEIEKSITKRQLPGRLKFKTVEKSKILSEKEHNRKIAREDRRAFLKRIQRNHAYKEARDYLDYEETADDGDVSSVKQAVRNSYSGMALYTRRNIKALRNAADPYRRLNFARQRETVLKNRRNRLQTRASRKYIDNLARGYAEEGIIPEGSKYYRETLPMQDTGKETARRQRLSALQHHKLKKEMVRAYKKEQGNLAARIRNQIFTRRASRKYRRMKRKRNLSILASMAGLSLTAIVVIFIIVLFMATLSDIFKEYGINTISPNDYYCMTEAAQYFRGKEADLEEALLPDNIEPEILAEFPEIYEFIYNLDEISFDANTLVAYLSAKYGEFAIDEIQGEMDDIFEEYYKVTTEIKEEEREIPDETAEPDPVTGSKPTIRKSVQICYITLEKKDFEELLTERMENEAQKQQMKGYYLSGNGQQMYNPVMEVDWRNKISSNYGWRIHPITKDRKFHDGVDIAVPTGTSLYSAVSGTVTKSYYSDSGGNMVTVQTDSGWTVTFMHMDSRTVMEGQRIEKGQHVGYSGNTGNSTGPHLHLQVHDQDKNPVNPIFIIPFSTAEASETFN